MDNTYDVYFELYGKKMKTTVSAKSRSEAKEIIKDKIIFHKIEQKDSPFGKAADKMSETIDAFAEYFSGKLKKKKDNPY